MGSQSVIQSSNDARVRPVKENHLESRSLYPFRTSGHRALKSPLCFEFLFGNFPLISFLPAIWAFPFDNKSWSFIVRHF